MAADVRLLCDGLGALTENGISAPLLIAIYTRLTLVTVGWIGPAGLAGYYLVGLTLSRLLLGPVARAVLLQQACSQLADDRRSKRFEGGM